MRKRLVLELNALELETLQTILKEKKAQAFCWKEAYPIENIIKELDYAIVEESKS